MPPVQSRNSKGERSQFVVSMRHAQDSGGLERASLSVIVPCHDAGPLLNEAVASVLDQRGEIPPLEVVLVDDRSSDPTTLRALEAWPARDPRVRLIRHAGPPGVAGARNAGIRAARGDWIAFLDADDLWLPHAVATRWEVVRSRPDAAFVSADFAHLHEDGTVGEGFYRTRPVPRRVLANALETGRVLRLEKPVRAFLEAVLVWTGVALVRRESLESVGGFEEDLRRVEDDHLWIRIAHQADLFFVPDVVALYRQREGSLTRSEEPPSGWNVKAYRKLLRDPSLRPHRDLIRRRLSRFAQKNAYWHRARGETLRAVQEGYNAVRWDPRRPQAWRTLAGALLGRA